MKDLRPILVVSEPGDIPPEAGHVVLVDDYLNGPPELCVEGVPVVNLTRSWRYLSKGYYVSLLADARGQEPIPTIHTVEEMSQPAAMFRVLHEAGVPTLDTDERSDRLRAASVRAEGPVDPDVPLLRDTHRGTTHYRSARPEEIVTAMVFVGRCSDVRFQRIASLVYRIWPTPVQRLKFVLDEDTWRVFEVKAIKVNQLEPADKQQLVSVLRDSALGEKIRPTPPPEDKKASIAILYDETDPNRPSTLDTIERMERVAARKGVYMHRIGVHDIGRLTDYDALFIRTYTSVHTAAFRFAVRAEALGMPVIDDPQSIIRCTNKVFLHELLRRENIATPKTRTVAKGAAYAEILAELGTPFIVKLPDGAFSAAVFKVTSETDWRRRSTELFKHSPLLVAQAWTPSDYDWRVTTLGGKPLFVAKYHMARGHWQIRNATGANVRYGRTEAVPRDQAPKDVVKLACRASRLIGDGLYGVDLKPTPDGPVVIEVNDNPNLDIGYDDAAEGSIVYEEIVDWYLRKLDDLETEDTDSEEVEDPMEALREGIGEVPEPQSGRPYHAYEVVGLELEYAVVNRNLDPASLVEPAMRLFAGRPTSDVELGLVGFSNEIVDHVFEIKTVAPLRSLVESEKWLVEGVRRFAAVLADRFDARLLPTGMHPWLDPKTTSIWQRSNRRIYDTYARLFDVRTHGWANVQATHVNLPLGTETEAVAMMNAAALILPYLPAISASSPMYERQLREASDNRLQWIIEHQTRVPESCGDIVPEWIDSLAGYRKDVLGPMYAAVDRLQDADVLRREYFNARGAVFKFSRKSMEVRVLDVQECVKVDAAIAAFTRAALKAVAERITDGKIERPSHAELVADFREVVKNGTKAQVTASHLCRRRAREGGKISVRVVLKELLAWARRKSRADEEQYLDLIEAIIERGNLSESIRRVLEPFARDAEGLQDASRKVYIQLSDCLVENEPWSGRGL